MKKVSVILVILSIFILSCGDETASDNDGGVTDNETVTDEETVDETSEGASAEALSCCQEIVKEWYRCEGSFDFDAVTGCVDCVAALETCDVFNPLDDNFSCKTECNLVCGVVALKGDGSGDDRRLIADEYCKFMMDPACDLRSTDFSSLGAIEGLDACYDM